MIYIYDIYIYIYDIYIYKYIIYVIYNNILSLKNAKCTAKLLNFEKLIFHWQVRR